MNTAENPLVWSKPEMNGTAPCSRGGHTAVLSGKQLVIFGGHYYGRIRCTLTLHIGPTLDWLGLIVCVHSCLAQHALANCMP